MAQRKANGKKNGDPAKDRRGEKGKGPAKGRPKRPSRALLNYGQMKALFE